MAGGSTVMVLQRAKGISRAKNVSIAYLSANSGRVVFCDADTRLRTKFIKQMSTRINRAGKGLATGTCSIIPEGSGGIRDRLWFKFFDLIHRLTRTAYALQMARLSVARHAGFRKDLEVAEDLYFIDSNFL